MKFSFLDRKPIPEVPKVSGPGKLRLAAIGRFGEDTEAAATAVCPRTAELVRFLDPMQPKSRDLTPEA